MAWKEGESGNPAGRAASKPFLDALNRALKADDGKRLRACAEKLLDRAAEGEPWAVEQLANRLDGKPHQTVGGEQGPLEIIIRDLNKEDAA